MTRRFEAQKLAELIGVTQPFHQPAEEHGRDRHRGRRLSSAPHTTVTFKLRERANASARPTCDSRSMGTRHSGGHLSAINKGGNRSLR